MQMIAVALLILQRPYPAVAGPAAGRRLGVRGRLHDLERTRLPVAFSATLIGQAAPPGPMDRSRRRKRPAVELGDVLRGGGLTVFGRGGHAPEAWSES